MDKGGSSRGNKGNSTTLDAESRDFLEQFGDEFGEEPVTETEERPREDSGNLELPVTKPPKQVTCSNCGNTFEQTPGRQFRKCENCRLPQAKETVSLTKTKEPVGKHLDLRLRRVAAGVEENLQMLGAVTVFVMPTTGTIICRDAEKIAENLVKLCKKYPKLITALETANQAAPGLLLGKSVATIAIAAMVDMNRINQEEVMKGNVQIANMLGVAKVFNDLHSVQGENNHIVTPAPPQAAFL